MVLRKPDQLNVSIAQKCAAPVDSESTTRSLPEFNFATLTIPSGIESRARRKPGPDKAGTSKPVILPWSRI